MDIVERIRQQSYFGLEPYEAADEIEQLRQRVQELEKELEVERMRLAACSTAALGYFDGCCDEYKSASLADVLGLRESNEKLTAERDKATQYWQIAEGRCDALMKHRDELVAAIEPFVKHNSSKSVIDLAIRTSDIAKARAAIASVKEK